MADLVRNAPCPVGTAAGEQLARLAAPAIDEARKLGWPEPCKTCAFRLGTYPNRCMVTVADAIKCLMEHEPFYCHDEMHADGTPAGVCSGWLAAAQARPEGAGPIRMPWGFSGEADE